MKMLLVLFDKQGQILLCRNPSGYSVPTNGAEVDEALALVHHRKKTGGFGKTAVCLYTGVIFAFIWIIVPLYLSCMAKVMWEKSLSGWTAAV